MSEIQKIAKLLAHEAPERRIAAAIVLGELRAGGVEVIDGLVALATSGSPPLQAPALEALARIGGRRAVPHLFPLLGKGDRDVRRAAGRAIAAGGPEVVPLVKARMAEAESEEKRALDEILAELGGKDAFAALLQGLFTEDVEQARAAALAVRHHVKETDGKERRRLLAQVEKFLTQKQTLASPIACAGALKILGYLEDEAAAPTLLAWATDRKAAAIARQEALIALRFALGRSKEAPRTVAALLKIVADAELSVARTAIDTLGNLTLTTADVPALLPLVTHPDGERARFAIERLGALGGERALGALGALLATAEKNRAELAAQALSLRADAASSLAAGLLAATDPDRAWSIAKALRAQAKGLPKKTGAKLLAHALQTLEAGARGWEAPLSIARELDPEAVAEALRELAERLKKGKKLEKALAVFRLLARSEHATDPDRLVLALLELSRSTKNLAARSQDEALVQLRRLAERGFDVATALRKERSIELEEKFYVGFDLLERDLPGGVELLQEVVAKAGRTKLGKAAKNKLALADAG